MSRRYLSPQHAVESSIETLKKWGNEVDAGHWQGVSTTAKPDLVTIELIDWDFECPVGGMDYDGDYLTPLRTMIQPNLPWADDHFEERVSRVPSNPGKEYRNWPWWGGQMRQTAAGTEGESFIFTHTYQERFWPKEAWLDAHVAEYPTLARDRRMGIRYDYGDLDDVVNLLLREPYTRQAYLPIFFPEDTGAVHGGRIPCTLGYHFMLRNNKLHMWYTIRSCDVVRHFRDDVYLAMRLGLWVLDELREAELRSHDPQVWVDVAPGPFYFKAFSFHLHKGDLHHVSS